jgi:hypothetical protein
MKPKPFSELNHLTVPVAMYLFSFDMWVIREILDSRSSSCSSDTDYAKHETGTD